MASNEVGRTGMSELRGMLEFKIDVAVAYTLHKGRMPRDVHELREWLREFAELESMRADRAFEVLKEHMNTCNRPILWPRKETP